MDFITHTLVGSSIARCACRARGALGQMSVAAVFASLLPDADSALALMGQEVYGRYHRVMSHSIVGLIVVVILAAGLSRLVALPSAWRRFGWFVSDNIPPDEPVPDLVPFRVLLAMAACGAGAHWVGDWITGYGNITPLWPWVERDISLAAVNSFDPVLFASTLICHVVLRQFPHGERRCWAITATWFAICAAYVAAKATWGEAAVW